MNSPRIVSLLASGTEIVAGLGAADHLVGISHECDHPAEITDRPRVTKTRVDPRGSCGEINEQVTTLAGTAPSLYELDVERLSALRPDVIVTQGHCEVCAVHLDDVMAVARSRPELANAKLVVLNPQRFEDVVADVACVGAAIDREDEAKEVVSSLKARIKAVEEATSGLSEGERPRVVCLEWLDPIMVAANWLPRMVHLAGGRCDLTEDGDRSEFSDWAGVAAFDPEVIVSMPCGMALEQSARETEALFGRLGEAAAKVSAVREGRVYAVDANAYFTRSGPRIVDSLEILTRLVNPERFGDLPGGYDQACCRLALT